MPFAFISTPIDGLIIIEPQVFGDERGFFFESYKASDFLTNGIDAAFVQDNHAFSSKGVVRGLHFQTKPLTQGKLVRVLAGSVWDVAVDLRQESATFAKVFGLELSGDNKKMLFVPPGFAHGYATLEDNTHFLYKCTAEYSPQNERGVRYDDPDLGIDWPLKDVVASKRDVDMPTLAEIRGNLAEWL
jgi:dTDP-4-dehydrorhamnose 3,5-epimerase